MPIMENTDPPSYDDVAVQRKEEEMRGEVEAGDTARDAERPKWGNQVDFIMSCIGYAVGLGNLWRFPYLCFKNGGGAFLLPYFSFVILCGIPLFFMEISLGQFLQAGSVRVWKKTCPVFKGAGLASVTMAALCCIYYAVIIAWTILYLFHSFTDDLMWQYCDQPWNNLTLCLSPGSNKTAHLLNNSLSANHSQHLAPPVEQFWEEFILGMSSGLGEAGTVRWDLAICLVIGWIFTYLIIYKGLHSSGKILWFTAIFPYVILITLFGFGLSLDGSGDGILFYLKPDLEKLLTPQVWIDAGTQVFFSYGIGMGSLSALGSYNKYNNNCYRDAVLVGCINSGTSFFAGFVIFSVLGFMAKQQDTTVGEVVKTGPGLAFLAYPEAVVNMPAPPVWAVLFFLMLLILGIDSQFCMLEGFITGASDEFRSLRENPRRKMLFTLVASVVLMLLGLPMVTQGGVFLFQLMDYYSASGITLLFVVFFEVMAFNWCFGTDNMYKGLKDMLGFRPSRYWYFCWRYISPTLILGVFIFSFVMYEPVKYGNEYVYPWWGEMLGLFMGAASMLWIPCYAIYYLLFKTNREHTWKERVLDSIRPDIELTFRNLGDDEMKPPKYVKTVPANYIAMSDVLTVSAPGAGHGGPLHNRRGDCDMPSSEGISTANLLKQGMDVEGGMDSNCNVNSVASMETQ